jgi:hypothetical protein
MQRLDRQISTSPAWQDFLRNGASDSRVETAFHLLELERKARQCQVACLAVGYDRFPVIDPHTRRVLGHRPMPALITDDWLLIPQVTVLTPATYTLDALLVVHRPHRTFIDLEIDGPGHAGSNDPRRAAHLQMPSLRLTERDVLANISLTDRLRGLGYCSSRRPRT